jgi:hypothetical protein
MRVNVDCPGCSKTLSFPAKGETVCGECGHRLRRQAASGDTGILERCAACGEYRLYRQKDLNRNVGVAVVLGSAALSLAMLPVSPAAAYAVLFLLALVDFGLYRRLPEVIICYRCKAQHRGYAPESQAEPFDLLTAEVIDQQVRDQGKSKHPSAPA